MRSAIPEYTLQDYWMAAKHLNKKNAGKPSFWWLMLFYTDLLLLLQPSVLWLSIVTFNNDAKLRPKWILREFSIANPTPSRRVTPPWNVYMAAKFDPGWEGCPVWQTGLSALAGHPTQWQMFLLVSGSHESASASGWAPTWRLHTKLFSVWVNHFSENLGCLLQSKLKEITGLLSLLQSEDWIVGYLTSCDIFNNYSTRARWIWDVR